MKVNLSELREMVIDREALCCDSWGRKESDTAKQLHSVCPLMEKDKRLMVVS